jgi:hypothetical protein
MSAPMKAYMTRSWRKNIKMLFIRFTPRQIRIRMANSRRVR